MNTRMKIGEVLRHCTMAAADALVHVDDGGEAIKCLACANGCVIHKGKCGACGVRLNIDGQLRVPGDYISGLQIDPIEKKPFFHVYPGSDALSFGMLGCNLHCAFCQNWYSSQAPAETDRMTTITQCVPEQLVSMAKQEGAKTIVSTYNEPLITSDWAFRVFEKAHEVGIDCGFVSNGNATPEVVKYLRPVMALYKVDLKCFRDGSYRELGCSLGSVLRTIEQLIELKYWVEIVTLVVPGFNDDETELREIAAFIANLSPDIPWHVTAFHPDYKMNNGHRTATETLKRACDIGNESGLRYVYAGNMPGLAGDHENTFCPECRAILIHRQGFSVVDNGIVGNKCNDCGQIIPGVW